MGSSRITAGVISGTGNIDSWIAGMGIAGSSVPGSGDLVMVIQPQERQLRQFRALFSFQGTSSISAKPGASGIGPRISAQASSTIFRLTGASSMQPLQGKCGIFG